MTDEIRPIPRPRQLKSTSDETDSSSRAYENYTIKPANSGSLYDNVNAQLNELKIEMQRPQPTPRTRVNRNYENSPDLTKHLNNNQPDLPPKTGAIRKTTNIPKVENKLNDKEEETVDETDDRKRDVDDVLSLSSSTSGKSNSEKFITPSPSDIIKSIGESSKMLSEAIGERITDKTASAKHKLLKEYKHSKNVLDSWTSGTKTTTAKKLKNVRAKFDHFSLKRNKAQRSLSNDADERPQTINIGNDEMFQSLTFNSPLNNNRSYNLENIPDKLSSSTYEIPKKFQLKSNEDLPDYEDVIHDTDFLKRNSNLTRSLNALQTQKLNNLDKAKNTNVVNITASDSSESEGENNPPNLPAPTLPDEPIYGRVKRVQASDYENAPIIPLRKPPPPPVSASKRKEEISETVSEPPSNRVTFSSTISDSCTLTDLPNFNTDNRSTVGIGRSDSWRYVDSNDNISQLTIDSIESEEPIYSNDENERIGKSEPPFIQNNNILQPTKILNTDQSTLTREILNEFDPLSRESFDNYIMSSMNHITLLETLLSEETYGTIHDTHTLVDAEHLDDNSSEESLAISSSSANFDSNTQLDKICNKVEKRELQPAPLPPQRIKPAQRQASVIIHQNLKLKDSMENLVEPFLAKVDNDQPSTSGVVDLSKPKAQKTSWFVDSEEADKFIKNNLDNPNNFQHPPADKLTKSVPQLPKINNLTANQSPSDADAAYLPSYEESQNDEIVARVNEKPSNTPMKSISMIFNFNLKRRSSLKEKKIDPKDFIPHPPFSDDPPHSHDKNIILFKLPSGVIEDMLKELNPRFIELRKRQFKAYADPEFKVLKEHLDLTYLTSIQYLINHKFNDFKTDCGRQIFCFEINLAVPKSGGNSNALLDNKGIPVRTQRVSFVYGIHSKQEKCMWMQKILRGVTNVFPKEYTCDYIRAGSAYMKKSISSAWSGTWILLSRRKLFVYDYTESRLEMLDLRKARCIGLKENDDSIQNLFVEKGPIMLIDAPPHTCYLIMNTTRETKIWSVVIKDEAHANGNQLRHQQLTKDNVPVFVDKCINFVYTNGTMSEGIYRKAGSSSNIQKLTTALRKDAFSVQITRFEYNENDVSSALKRFLRELPEPLMGKLAVSFLSVSEMKSSTERVKAYRELLQRLPQVEYQTLKKLLGHLHFIQAQKEINKMKAENLAMVFGPTLMQPQNNENQYTIDSRDAEVIAELIINYKKLYELTPDEIKTEQIMLTVLQKYHNAAENLSDTVKKSGDFKVWITLDPCPELNIKQEDKRQINVALTPTKTVFELCKEFETQMNTAAHKMTLMEVILNGELQRPLHYNEKVLNVVLRWANWPDADRKTNYLELRPQTKFHLQVERTMKTLPSFTPCMELKFADKKTKSMKSFMLELNDTIINVLKVEKTANVKVKDVDVSNCVVYLGSEKKRDNQCRWALTLVELNFSKRNRDSPFIGAIIGGNNINDQTTWYTSIMFSAHGYDISPNPEIVIT